MTAFIQKKSLADEVAAALQEQVTGGHYQLNEKLPIEPELMKSFGVGRSTIREAIKILANSGMLRVQQGVGTFVDSITGKGEPMELRLKRADIRDLDEVRQLLEMKIAEKAAVNRTSADIEKIKIRLAERKQYAEEGLLEPCIEADILFHTAIAEASKNEILADLYKSTSVHLKKWFFQIYKDTSVFVESQHMHEHLFKSIVAGDAKKSWNAAAKIIGHVSR